MEKELTFKQILVICSLFAIFMLAVCLCSKNQNQHHFYFEDDPDTIYDQGFNQITCNNDGFGIKHISGGFKTAGHDENIFDKSGFFYRKCRIVD